MSKNKFQGHPPHAKKSDLVAAAKAQTTKTEAAVLGAAMSGDQQAAAEVIVNALQTPTEQAKAEEVKAPPPTKTDLYTLGKKYSPKTDRNSETWGKITKALTEGPKTMKELTEVVKGHGDFLGYMTRGGHILPYVPAKVEEAAVS